jgi:hypothetical protein
LAVSEGITGKYVQKDRPSGQVLARDFQKFGETVLMDPEPSPVEVFCFYEHPSVPDRIRLFASYDPWTSGPASCISAFLKKRDGVNE